MTNETSDMKGTVHVSPTAVATVASQALMTSYGVVGMASKNAINDLAATITRDPNRGIDVKVERGRITIDVYVIIQHGTRISSVAGSVINAVRFNVEKALDMQVYQVNVYVQGLRVAD